MCIDRIVNYLKAILVCVIASSVVIPIWTWTAAQSVKPSTARTATYYDGRTLFRGFYFGTGPVAQLFPELYGHVKPPSDDIKAKEEQWLYKIDQADPAFFKRFEKLINSRRRVNVIKALDEGSDKLAQVFADETGVSASDLRSGKFPEPRPAVGLTILLPVAWAAVVFAAVAVENTAAVHYALAITRNVTFWNKVGAERELFPGYNRESRLAQDRFASVVVARLSH